MGAYGKAESHYARMLAIYEKTLGSDHIYVAASLNKLADLYREQGAYDKAEPFYRRALAIYEKAQGQDVNAAITQSELAKTLNQLATLYSDKGAYDAAEQLYKRALAIYEKTVGSDPLVVAAILDNLAQVQLDKAAYDVAEPLLKRALAIREQAVGPDHPAVATSLHNLARLYKDKGIYHRAESLYQRSLAILEKAKGPDHLDVAYSLNSLALLYSAKSDHDLAGPLFERSLVILEKVLGPNHPKVATILNNLAHHYGATGSTDEELRLHKRALAIYEKALGPNHPSVAGSLNNLAALHQSKGAYDRAEQLYKRAMAIYERALGGSHPLVAKSLGNVASLAGDAGAYDQAELQHKRALAIFEKAVGPDHPDVATSHGNLSYLYFRQSRLNDALAEIRQATHIQARLGAVESKSGKGQVTKQIGDFDFHAMLIGRLLATTPQRGELTDEAFAVAQRARGGTTAAALAQMAARASAGNDVLTAKVREQQDALTALRQFDRALIDMLGKPAGQRSTEAEGALRERIAEMSRRLGALNAELQRDYPDYNDLVSPEPLTVADTQKLLGPDEALLAYLVLKEETLLWVIRRDRAEMIRLEAGSAILDAQVKLLRQNVDLQFGLPEYPYATAYALYRTVFAPALPHLDGAEYLMLVADGSLQSLPFGMLVSAEVAPDIKDKIPWLIRQYAFTNLPAVASLRALRRQVGRQAAEQPMIGYGDPVFKGTKEDARSVSLARLFARGALADTRELQNMARLPETADELMAIARTLQAPISAIRLRELATEAQVKQTNLLPYRVVAFATHGLMAGDFKGLAEPALALTPPAVASDLDDGLLTASEVAGLKLNADWVLLSACNTAAPDGKPGAEGFSGLTKAFFYSGARTLLVSHWAVDSEATVALTTRMFDEAGKGAGRAEALRRSMLALADHPTDPALRHPAMWAPFVVVGEGSRVR
jgi:CHAT domain-containing protein/tetratricopeptide (TPR) repeat protein